MSSVLFDNPGPRTKARHKVYSVVAAVALGLVVAGIVWLMYVNGQFAYELWEPFVTPEFIEVILVDGLLKTLQMAFFSVIFALGLGLVLGVGKMSDHAWVRWPCWGIVEFFRAVPLLLLIIFIFFTFGTGGGIGSFWSVVVGLTLYNGAVLAEVFRAGVNAVPSGQAEAAYAIGMRKSQVMNIVLLPQAIKIMLPAIISQMVVALKDTSLGFYILAPGLTAVGKLIYTEFRNPLPTAIVVTSLYVAASLVLSLIATRVQRRLVGEQKPLEAPDMATGSAV